MKNLSYFLWLCVLGLLSYVVYFFATTTKWREQDLQIVMKQNQSISLINNMLHQLTFQIMQDASYTILKCSPPSYIELMKKARRIHALKEQTFQEIEQAYYHQNWLGLNNIIIKYPILVSHQDTSLRTLAITPDYIDFRNLGHTVFSDTNNLLIKTKFNRIENQAITTLCSRIWCCMFIDCIRAKVYAKPQTVSTNGVYEAYCMLISSQRPPEHFMKITKGSLVVEGNEGAISYVVPSVKINTQQDTLQATITIPQSFNTDTTIYLSTTYTVRRKK